MPLEIDASGCLIETPAVGAALRRSYGEALIATDGQGIPANLAPSAIELGGASGGNVDILNRFDGDYALADKKLKILSGGQYSEVTGRWADWTELRAAMLTAVPNDGTRWQADVTIDVYDEIDGEICEPSKMYGRNAAWHRLFVDYGTPNYYSASYDLGGALNTNVSWSGQQNALARVWLTLFGSAFPQAAGSFTDAGAQCFWLPRNRHRYYDHPHLQALDVWTFDGMRNRKCVDQGNAIVASPVSNTGETLGDRFTHAPVPIARQPWCYLVVNSNGTSFTENHDTFWGEMADRLRGNAGMVVCIPLVRWVDRDAGRYERAVLLKPVGVNEVDVDYFDDSLYRLELIGTRKEAFHPRLVVPGPDYRFTSVGPTERFRNKFGGRIQGSDIMDAIGASDGSTYMSTGHSYPGGKVRAQLRDLATGKVSPLSIPEIQIWTRRRLAPFQARVVNRELR